MANRVIVQAGKTAALVVAPHGHVDNDFNTDIIADVIATQIKAYSIVNVGWARGERANLAEGVANLNDIQHCLLGPCRREFLDPLVRLKDEIVAAHGRCHIFYIHGMHNNVRDKVKDDVDLVLGYGQGEPASLTCALLYKNALAVRLREQVFNVYQARSGGRFAAWRRDNLTQYFRQHRPDERVQAVQIEIVNALRNTAQDAVRVGLRLADAIDNLQHGVTRVSKSMALKEC